jgi:hypothetical protein
LRQEQRAQPHCRRLENSNSVWNGGEEGEEGHQHKGASEAKNALDANPKRHDGQGWAYVLGGRRHAGLMPSGAFYTTLPQRSEWMMLHVLSPLHNQKGKEKKGKSNPINSLMY